MKPRSRLFSHIMLSDAVRGVLLLEQSRRGVSLKRKDIRITRDSFCIQYLLLAWYMLWINPLVYSNNTRIFDKLPVSCGVFFQPHCSMNYIDLL